MHERFSGPYESPFEGNNGGGGELVPSVPSEVIFPAEDDFHNELETFLQQSNNVVPEEPIAVGGIDREIVDLSDPVKLYLREIAEYPLLTREQEFAYGSRIQQGLQAKDKLQDEALGNDEKLQYEESVTDGALAKDALVKSNLRLVVSIAKKYVNRGLSFLDLIQEGNMGAMIAADKYDPERGFRFSTFATWWIKQAVIRAISDHSRTIRLPVHMGDTLGRINRSVQQFEKENSRKPNNAELDEVLIRAGIKEGSFGLIKHALTLNLLSAPLSLDKNVGREDNASLSNFVSSTADTAEEVSGTVFNEEILESAKEGLTERELAVIQMRFGFFDGKIYTLIEVGEQLQVSRERIRQIESNALRKMRKNLQTQQNFDLNDLNL